MAHNSQKVPENMNLKMHWHSPRYFWLRRSDLRDTPMDLMQTARRCYSRQRRFTPERYLTMFHIEITNFASDIRCAKRAGLCHQAWCCPQQLSPVQSLRLFDADANDHPLATVNDSIMCLVHGDAPDAMFFEVQVLHVLP